MLFKKSYYLFVITRKMKDRTSNGKTYTNEKYQTEHNDADISLNL